MAQDGDKNSQSQIAHNGPVVGHQPVTTQPPKPNPSADDGIVPPIIPPSFDQVGDVPTSDNYDVMVMEPLLALKILARGAQGLVDLTGNVPPTPPIHLTPTSSGNTTPSLRTESNSKQLGHRRIASSRPASPSRVPSNDIKSAKFPKVQIGDAEAHSSEPAVPHSYVDASVREQHDAIARKFFSKKPPPIGIDEYLLRLHRYCPMSTAVYLAAGLYIHRLSMETKAVPVTPRTVHRLLLAALRVAMKALEDLSYPHKRFSGVGGVSEKELAKLEISLCYLMDFNLKVNNEQLKEKSWALLQLAKARGPQKSFVLNLPTRLRSSTT